VNYYWNLWKIKETNFNEYEFQRIFTPKYSTTDRVFRINEGQINVRLRYAREVDAIFRNFYIKGQNDADNVIAILKRLIKESLIKNTHAINLLKENSACHHYSL
jgi:hypothetical protein